MKSIFIFLLLAISLSACSLPEHSFLGHRRLFLYGVPEGNDRFSQGWRDGCDNGLALAGTGTLRLVNDETDPQTVDRMVHDPLYEKGYIIGSSYCTNFLDYNSG